MSKVSRISAGAGMAILAVVFLYASFVALTYANAISPSFGSFASLIGP